MPVADNAQLLLSIDATTEILRSEIAKGTAALEKFATKSEQDAGRVAHAFEKMGERAKETAIEFAKLGAEILIGATIKSAIEKSIEYSETLVKTGQQLGVTTKFLQEFRFAAGQTATSSEAADKSLAKFSVTLGRAAEGNKVAAEAFSKINVKIADTNGNLRPSEAIFRDVADAIAKIPGPAQQASAAVAIFGRGGQSLLPILLSGAEGFNKFGEEAEKAGLILADGTIDRLEEVSNAAKKVKQEISVELARAIGDNAEALFALGRGAISAAAAMGTLLDKTRGIRVATGDGDFLEPFTHAHGDPAKIGTPSGRVEYEKQRLAEARAALVEAAKPGIFGDTLSAPHIAVLRAAGADVRRRQGLLGDANDQLLAYNTPANAFSPKEGDLGATGSKVTPPKDVEADREARRAAAEAARAQNEADRIATAAEARLVTIKKELNSVDAQIIEEQAKLSTNPADKLAADIAGAQAKTDKIVADAKIEAGNDTTKAQKDERNKFIEHEKDLGKLQIQYIKENDARQHALTLQSIDDQNAQIELANRAANVALIKDDELRADAEKKLASDTVDFQIAQINREIEANRRTLTPEEIAAKRRTQSDLAAGKTAQLSSIDRANQGPVQNYLDSLPLTASKANDAFENVAVGGLRAFDDGLTGLISGTQSLASAVSHMATSIIADLARIAIEKAILGPLAAALGLGGGGDPITGGIASLISSNSGISIPSSGLKFADGGSPPIGMASLVGERGPELFVPKVPGIIIPNGGANGGGGLIINVDARQAQDPAQTAAAVRFAVTQAVATSRNDLRVVTRQRMPGSR
jgi:hypothetical protein